MVKNGHGNANKMKDQLYQFYYIFICHLVFYTRILQFISAFYSFSFVDAKKN
jgi:hypothetical protein